MAPFHAQGVNSFHKMIKEFLNLFWVTFIIYSKDRNKELNMKAAHFPIIQFLFEWSE